MFFRSKDEKTVMKNIQPTKSAPVLGTERIDDEAIDRRMLSDHRTSAELKERIMALRDAARTAIHLGQESRGQAFGRRAAALFGHWKRYAREYQG